MLKLSYIKKIGFFFLNLCWSKVFWLIEGSLKCNGNNVWGLNQVVVESCHPSLVLLWPLLFFIFPVVMCFKFWFLHCEFWFVLFLTLMVSDRQVKTLYPMSRSKKSWKTVFSYTQYLFWNERPFERTIMHWYTLQPKELSCQIFISDVSI